MRHFVVALALVSAMLPVGAMSASHSRPIPAPVVFVQHGAGASAPTDCPHVVVSGETLSLISPSWASLGITVPSGNPNVIFPGDVINTCPGTGASQPSVTPYVAPGAVSGEPCTESIMFANVGQWTTPPGCYGTIYQGYWWNGSADCFAHVQAINHGRVPNMSRHSSPVVGAVASIPGGDQGAMPEGHYAEVIGISGGWMLISEQNMFWRGGGYGRINYRYLRIDGWITYLY